MKNTEELARIKESVESLISEIKAFFPEQKSISDIFSAFSEMNALAKKAPKEIDIINSKIEQLREDLYDLSEDEINQVSGGEINYFSVFGSTWTKTNSVRVLVCPVCNYEVEKFYAAADTPTDYFCPVCQKQQTFKVLEKK